MSYFHFQRYSGPFSTHICQKLHEVLWEISFKFLCKDCGTTSSYWALPCIVSCHFDFMVKHFFGGSACKICLSEATQGRMRTSINHQKIILYLITVKEVSNNIQLPFKSIKCLPNQPTDGTIVLLLPLKCKEIRHILVNKTKIHWWMMRPRHTEASVSESSTVGVRPLVTRPQRGKPKQFATLTLFPRGEKCLS